MSVPEPPRLFRGSYEVMASVSGGSRSLRLHWAVYPAENIHGDNLTFVVRVGSMTQETRHHFIDLVNLTHPGVLNVFAKNEVGMSEKSGNMILPELQYPDILPKPLEAADLEMNVFEINLILGKFNLIAKWINMRRESSSKPYKEF